MNKFFGLVLAFAFAALALPAAAQTLKLQTIAMSSSLGANGLLTVTWLNSSPPGGNSQISSATIQSSNFKFLQPPATKSSTGTVAVSSPDGKTVTIQKMSPVKPGKFFTVTLAVDTTGLNCGDATDLTFTAFTGSSLGGDVFQDQSTLNFYSTKHVTYSCTTGVVCEDAIADGSSAFSGDLLSGIRLPNKDGSACEPTTVFTTTTVDATSRKVSVAPGANQPNALFDVVVGWPAEFVDSTTGMPKATQVSWQLDSGGNPINFATGRACIRDVSSAAPLTAYTALAADIPQGVAGETITISTTTTAVFPVTPSSTNPVPVVVNSERMNVIGQSGSILTVKRFGGTNGTTQVAHTANTPVMPTPFPLDGSGKVMLVCIAEESFASVDANQCSPVTPTQACVEVTTRVLGDLTMIR